MDEHITLVLLQFAAMLGGGIWAVRRWPIERKAVEANIRSDNATTVKTYAEVVTEHLESYNSIFQLLQSRDEDILELRKEVRDLKSAAQDREKEQEREKARLEEENAALRKEVADLKAEVGHLKQQLDQLTIQGEGT